MQNPNTTRRFRAATPAHVRRIYAPVLAATLLSLSAISTFSASSTNPDVTARNSANLDLYPATAPASISLTTTTPATVGHVVLITKHAIDFTALPETAFGDNN